MERERVHLLPNGIDLELFAPNGRRLMKKKQHAALQPTGSSLAMWPGFMK